MGAFRILGVLLIVGTADYYSFGLFGFITGTSITATGLLVGGIVLLLFGVLGAVFG